MPRVPWHAQGVTSCVMVSRTMSVGVPPRALLVRTHAPVLHPPPGWALPSTPGLCRLRSAPAGRRTFPTFSLRLCPGVLGPLPRRLVRGPCPFLPSRPRPSPRADRVGAPPCTVQRLPYGALCRGWQLCADVQARRCACHPDRSYRYSVSRLEPYFYVRASRGLLPPHAPDMLTVCIGPWTVWGLTPHQIRSLVGCSPNASAQARLEAGAR